MHGTRSDVRSKLAHNLIGTRDSRSGTVNCALDVPFANDLSLDAAVRYDREEVEEPGCPMVRCISDSEDSDFFYKTAWSRTSAPWR